MRGDKTDALVLDEARAEDGKRRIKRMFKRAIAQVEGLASPQLREGEGFVQHL